MTDHAREMEAIAETNARRDGASAAMLEALQKAAPILARYGSRERNPDEEAWAAYSWVIRAIYLATGKTLR